MEVLLKNVQCCNLSLQMSTFNTSEECIFLQGSEKASLVQVQVKRQMQDSTLAYQSSRKQINWSVCFFFYHHFYLLLIRSHQSCRAGPSSFFLQHSCTDPLTTEKHCFLLLLFFTSYRASMVSKIFYLTKLHF